MIRTPAVHLLPLLLSLGLAACKADDASKPAVPGPAPSAAASAAPAGGRSVHALTVKKLDGSETKLGAFAGKVLLVVNTASECGYTPQYEGLQKLHAKYAARGFSVLGFPSNDFGGQEPGSSKEIETFCKSKYGVEFPMFEKVKTTGDGRAELYALLSDAKGPPKWNFHKYLLDKQGRPVGAWPSATTPDALEIARAIEAQLAAP